MNTIRKMLLTNTAPFVSAPADVTGAENGNGNGNGGKTRRGRRVLVEQSVYAPGDTSHEDVEQAVDDYRAISDDELAGLSDSDIVTILAQFPGSGDDKEVERAQALEDANAKAKSDVATPSIAITSATKSSMQAIGALFPDELSGLFVETQDRKEMVDGAPLQVAAFIDKTPALRAKLDAGDFPLPGTRWDAKEGESKHPGNRVPDYYSDETPTGAKDSGSRYADVFAGSSAGRYMLEVKALLQRAKKNESLPGDRAAWSAIPNENSWDDLADDKKYQAIIGRWNNRFTNSVARFRTGQSYRLQRVRFQDFRHLEVHMVDKNLAVASRKKNPLLIHYAFPGDTPGMSQPYSIQTFNRIDLAKARAIAASENKPVNLSHIKKTVSRPPRKVDTTPVVPTEYKAKDFPMVINALANTLNQRTDGYAKRLADIVETLTAQGSDETLENFGNVYHELRELFAPHSKRYDAIKEARRVADETEAQQETVKTGETLTPTERRRRAARG